MLGELPVPGDNANAVDMVASFRHGASSYNPVNCLHTSCSAQSSDFSFTVIVKARFRRRTSHEPNLIRIKADPNY